MDTNDTNTNPGNTDGIREVIAASAEWHANNPPPEDIDPLRDKITVSLSGYIAYVLSLDDLQEPMRNVQPDCMDVMCIDTEQSSLVVHIFEGARLEVLLRHHHQKGEDDIMRFSCQNFLENKELSYDAMGGVSVPGNPGSIGEALALGVVEMEKSTERLHETITDLTNLTLTAGNSRYITNLPAKRVQRISSYTDMDLPF
jgi:hypothetical protein